MTFDLELWQNKRRNQKRPLLKMFNLVQVSFVPSGIILLQIAVGMLLTCPLEFEYQSGVRARDHRISKQTALPTASGPPPNNAF